MQPKASILIAASFLVTGVAAGFSAQAQENAIPNSQPFTVVETGEHFSTLQSAVGAIGSGTGTIRIAPGSYRTCAVQAGGNITYMAEIAGSVTLSDQMCEGKALLVLRGQSARVFGIRFSKATVPDNNGSGIRLETGDLKVEQCWFQNSQGGILANDGLPNRIEVDRSTFSGLGQNPGTHSIYIGQYGLLRVTNSRFEAGRGGHYVKTRSPRVEILNNSFDDTQGRETNYMIDLSIGSTGLIAGNTFAVGGNKDNYSAIITVAPEARTNNSEDLLIENNRAWVSSAFKWSDTTFVANWGNDIITLRNNTLGPKITATARR